MPQNQLQDFIFEHIASTPQKRITFAEYMDLVLYQPEYGYYSAGKVKIGSQGDFFTSASLGSYFGELLAKQFAEMWKTLDCPRPFTLLEMGAGQGLLANDILHYLHLHHQDFWANLQYIIVEQAPAFISEQQKLLQPWQEKGLNISWHSWSEIPENSIIGCCFSNELVDAFPVHRITVKEGKLQEIYVEVSGDKLIEIADEISTDKLTEYFQLIDINLPSQAYPEGYFTEVKLAALDWLETVAKRLQKGYLLTIDYGYPAQRYYSPQRREGTLKCYYQHRHHNNPYVNLGSQDLTCHVDFTALEIQGEKCGLPKVDFTKQALFLMALGLGDRLANLTNTKLDLNTMLKRRNALQQLIDPTGLGNFGVLLQATPNCQDFDLTGFPDIP